MTVNDLNMKFKIILASGSPRRKEILELVGMEFDIWPSDKEEEFSRKEPCGICMELARMKALDVASQIRTYNERHSELVTETDMLIIGADTIVALGDTILTKPKDEADAIRMLTLLSGRTHSVYTGVSLVFMGNGGRVGEHTFFEETKVSFYPVENDEIEHYVSSYDVLDKAGAYGIQSGAAAFVRSIDGDFYNVVGLPVARILSELRSIGV
jgi:septum formation protein